MEFGEIELIEYEKQIIENVRARISQMREDHLDDMPKGQERVITNRTYARILGELMGVDKELDKIIKIAKSQGVIS